jgi:hypothetical protein
MENVFLFSFSKEGNGKGTLNRPTIHTVFGFFGKAIEDHCTVMYSKCNENCLKKKREDIEAHIKKGFLVKNSSTPCHFHCFLFAIRISRRVVF